MSRHAKPLILLAALIVLGAATYLLPVADLLGTGLEWIEAHRTIAWIVYIAGYIVATVLLIPGSVITIAGGFIFGLPLGVALVSAGSVIGATCSFLLGRSFVRDWVSERIAGLPRFAALDQATHSDGFVMVLLTRLSPIFPFNLLNYAFGLTAVRLRDYFFASWIGMLPGTVLYVYIGSAASDLALITAGQIEAGTAGTALLVAGLVATAILTVLITRRATRALNAQLDAQTDARGDDGARPQADEASPCPRMPADSEPMPRSRQ